MDLGPCPICLVPCPIADLVEHIVHAHAATKKQKCEKCTKEFELKSDLENHIKEKHSQPEIVEIEEIPQTKSPDDSSKENKIPDFVCQNCRGTFLSNKSLSMHMNTSKCGTVTNSIKHNCHNCSKSFKTFGGLKIHKKKCERKHPLSKQIKKAVKKVGTEKDKEGLSPLICPICDLKFKSEIQVQKHLTIHYDPKFLGSVFKIEPSKPKVEPKRDEGQLTQTSSDVHDQPSTSRSQTVSISNQDQVSQKEIEGSIDEVFQCPECEEPFSTLDTLKLHFKKSHKLPSKQLGASNLDRYLNKPLKPKSPVKLSISEVSNEDKHQIHNLDKVHQAPDADEPSKPKVEPKANEDEIEVVTEVKQVKCDQCDKSFKYRRILENHKIKVHDNRKTFPCADCDKVFDREIYLQSHRSYLHETTIKEDIDFKPIYIRSDSEDIVSVTFRCLSCPFSTEHDSEMINHHIETHLTIE